jgi:hypothetical protein
LRAGVAIVALRAGWPGGTCGSGSSLIAGGAGFARWSCGTCRSGRTGCTIGTRWPRITLRAGRTGGTRIAGVALRSLNALAHLAEQWRRAVQLPQRDDLGALRVLERRPQVAAVDDDAERIGAVPIRLSPEPGHAHDFLAHLDKRRTHVQRLVEDELAIARRDGVREFAHAAATTRRQRGH